MMALFNTFYPANVHALSAIPVSTGERWPPSEAQTSYLSGYPWPVSTWDSSATSRRPWSTPAA